MPMIKHTLAGLLLLLASGTRAETILYDQYEINGHPGYLSAWEVNHSLRHVLLIVPGFDTRNDSMPLDALQGDYAELVFFMSLFGWDVIYFDYVDGAIDLKDNADNLARFVEYLDSQAPEDYHLAVMAGSMGGIVARTMFVQEASSLGVDTYVSIDSPHWGVYLSNWAQDLAALAIDYPAAHQMHNGDPAYKEHYGWLRRVERSQWFREQVNGPMNTCAVSLSDGTTAWEVSWEDLALHNKYYPVASYVTASGLTSTYMPFHSTAYLDRIATDGAWRLGGRQYRYRNLTSSYFDKVYVNSRDEHAAPRYAILQALECIAQFTPRAG
ncbi:hypothetical protein F0M18_06570 [Pseudohalioglobus sediminis]|uniref:GPI inositol-deacylase PGAP1-like alpha/beta domain-containing protein n=1 Tax=Pseudohalioglobus sediminis TaxID=2606449 RepID=A0A5B0X2I7_9GAMM|nr:hypothetical protein [Pseudohalioglobus sediminis]KAA1193493.1 hypothetical protein F0M18_06570 [Pseudohalioglobus sediminis]